MKEYQFEKLKVKVLNSGRELGKVAAKFVKDTLLQSVEKRKEASLILATGASQFDFLDALRTSDIPWDRITVFHLDEYLGMSEKHPASFRRYLRERILNHVKPRMVHFLEGDARDVAMELDRYSRLLIEGPIDCACIGIGENGHIAFNDPSVADFDDQMLVKTVELDNACRNQQLGEGWFANLNEVPREALTLTIPAIMQSNVISCVVPEIRKAKAVHDALLGPVSEDCPASILRRHENSVLWLDEDSAQNIEQ